MSAPPPGGGWWQASDGKWYPPETHPGNQAAARPADQTGWSTGATGAGTEGTRAQHIKNPWRRFRNLALWKQVIAWVAVGFTVLVGIGAALGEDASNNAAHVTTTSPATSAPTTAPRTTAPPTTTAAPTTTVPATTAAPPTGPRPPGATTALSGLARLPVKGRAPLTGYSRAQFGSAWTDDVTVADGHNGCDTRNDILRRDLTQVVIKAGTHGCTVASGVLHDPYTNTVIQFIRGVTTSAAIQIDHVVALANAWQTGAQQLSLAVRTDFANDPLNLRAVSGSVNQQKGDGDAATWLPPNKAFRCAYVATQVGVKMRYHLWVTSAERDAISRVLATCPSQPLPAGGAPAPTTPARPAPTTPPRPAPTTRPAPPGPTPRPTLPTVHPGAFCTPAGARGVTSNGTPMVCKLDSTGQRLRWRRA